MQPGKKIVYSDGARKALVRGMSIMAKVVSLTLGPKGKNVVLKSKSSMLQITNDGATILKEIELEDQLENMGVALLRQAASKTNDVAGDGTTTATVLAYATVQEGMKKIAAGSNPVLIKEGMKKALYFITNKISEYSRPVESVDDIVRIASISAGNDLHAGLIISEAIKKVGREGIISLEEGHSPQTYLEISEGITIDKGYLSSHFLSQSDKAEICQENPLILLVDRKNALMQQDLVPVLEQAALAKRSLLIVAEEIEKEALAMLITNRLRGIVDVVAIGVPGLGDTKKYILEDLAILTGTQLISENLGLGLSGISLDAMGSAKRVLVSKKNNKNYF